MRWQRLLQRMLSDPRPVSYRYEDAAIVLRALGFEIAPTAGGSHRRWRLRTASGQTVTIGLVEKGHGTMKPYLIREMIAHLRTHRLIPRDLE